MNIEHTLSPPIMSPYSKKRSQELCRYLLNGQDCANEYCKASHDADSIRRQREWANKAPCRHGQTCTYLFHGNCCWFHSEEHYAYAEKRWEERAEAMTDGLVELEPLLVPDEPLTGPGFAGITDVQHLASFNKVTKGEIAVPGQ